MYVTAYLQASQPPVVVKQIIKSRILADCWKKHPNFGTIPIEIYVMSAISSASYTLPAVRPWHHARFGGDSDWIEGENPDAVRRGERTLIVLVQGTQQRLDK